MEGVDTGPALPDSWAVKHSQIAQHLTASRARQATPHGLERCPPSAVWSCSRAILSRAPCIDAATDDARAASLNQMLAKHGSARVGKATAARVSADERAPHR
jgi:hypothetical protein